MGSKAGNAFTGDVGRPAPGPAPVRALRPPCPWLARGTGTAVSFTARARSAPKYLRGAWTSTVARAELPGLSTTLSGVHFNCRACSGSLAESRTSRLMFPRLWQRAPKEPLRRARLVRGLNETEALGEARTSTTNSQTALSASAVAEVTSTWARCRPAGKLLGSSTETPSSPAAPGNSRSSPGLQETFAPLRPVTVADTASITAVVFATSSLRVKASPGPTRTSRSAKVARTGPLAGTGIGPLAGTGTDPLARLARWLSEDGCTARLGAGRASSTR